MSLFTNIITKPITNIFTMNNNQKSIIINKFNKYTLTFGKCFGFKQTMLYIYIY